MKKKTIVVSQLDPHHFYLSITVPHQTEDDVAVFEAQSNRNSKYGFFLTREEMESLARNSLGAFSPKVEVPRR